MPIAIGAGVGAAALAAAIAAWCYCRSRGNERSPAADIELQPGLRQVPLSQSACVICHEEITEGTVLGELPCKHAFHDRCIKEWISRGGGEGGSCPTCRASATPSQIKRQKYKPNFQVQVASQAPPSFFDNFLSSGATEAEIPVAVPVGPDGQPTGPAQLTAPSRSSSRVCGGLFRGGQVDTGPARRARPPNAPPVDEAPDAPPPPYEAPSAYSGTGPPGAPNFV